MIVVVVAFQTLKKNNQYQKKIYWVSPTPLYSLFVFGCVLNVARGSTRQPAFTYTTFPCTTTPPPPSEKASSSGKNGEAAGKISIHATDVKSKVHRGTRQRRRTWNTTKRPSRKSSMHATDVKSKVHRGTQQRRRTWNTTKRPSRKSSVHMRQCKYCTASLPSNL